jgi:hypothetical protein
MPVLYSLNMRARKRPGPRPEVGQGSRRRSREPGTTSPDDAFTRGAILLAEHLEIEPTLRDGRSAVGGFIDRRIVFRPAAPQ